MGTEYNRASSVGRNLLMLALVKYTLEHSSGINKELIHSMAEMFDLKKEKSVELVKTKVIRESDASCNMLCPSQRQ